MTFFTLGSGSGSGFGWVLRTACTNISRSSAFVFAGSRAGGFHELIINMWGLKPSAPAPRWQLWSRERTSWANSKMRLITYSAHRTARWPSMKRNKGRCTKIWNGSGPNDWRERLPHGHSDCLTARRPASDFRRWASLTERRPHMGRITARSPGFYRWWDRSAALPPSSNGRSGACLIGIVSKTPSKIDSPHSRKIYATRLRFCRLEWSKTTCFRKRAKLTSRSRWMNGCPRRACSRRSKCLYAKDGEANGVDLCRRPSGKADGIARW